MINFDIIKSSGKLKFTCEDSSLFEKIRENFSVENTAARFARRYSRFAPRRKYAITASGSCELGMYWLIRQYMIQEQINVNVNISANLKDILNVGTDKPLYDKFEFSLREYQEDVIKKSLKLGRGTCVLGTGAGKTFTTAALIENYFQNCKDKDTFKCIMLVPDLGLVTQTYDEFLNCGTTFKLTKWTGKMKPDLTANVIVCNIGIVQSRFDENDWMKYVDLLIVDECHKVKSDNKISKIISKIKTPNKYGFTGTLPEDNLDKWSIIGKLGPVIYEKSSFELRLEDYLTQVTVKILNINYKEKPHFSGQAGYRNELEYIYNSDKRNNIIKSLVSKLPANTLIMVNHIAHGDAIMEYLEKIEGKKVYFIQGSVDVEEREKIKAIMERETNVVVVAISAIFATGVNIKNLHNIIFASGGKSFIRTVQSIGRGLRKHASKDKLIIFDICDQLKYGISHSEKRKQIYDKEKIKYVEKDI